MKSYLDLLQHVLDNGADKEDRTGVGTRSIFGHFWKHDLSTGFPLLTTKKIHFKSVAIELLWFLTGSTSIKFMTDQGVTIWNEWADEDDELGPVYGKQWRRWAGKIDFSAGYSKADPSDTHTYGWVQNEAGQDIGVQQYIDQIADVIQQIQSNPNSRRLMVSAWNPADVPSMKLPPCHFAFQFNVTDGRLSCHMSQRSADAFLGVPFNIASYALLTHMVAHVTGLELGHLSIAFGDLHIYRNHMDQVREQLSRDPRPLPDLRIMPNSDGEWPATIDGFSYENFRIINYDPHPAIKAPIAV